MDGDGPEAFITPNRQGLFWLERGYFNLELFVAYFDVVMGPPRREDLRDVERYRSAQAHLKNDEARLALPLAPAPARQSPVGSGWTNGD